MAVFPPPSRPHALSSPELTHVLFVLVCSWDEHSVPWGEPDGKLTPGERGQCVSMPVKVAWDTSGLRLCQGQTQGRQVTESTQRDRQRSWIPEAPESEQVS